MTEFQRGNIEESIKDFDNVISVDSRYKPFLWQRGLSLYFAQRYDECASQFRGDVIVNPQDSEESIWTVMCESKFLAGGFAQAQKAMPILPAPDRRPIMRAAYQLFSTSSGTNSEQLLKALLTAGDLSGKNSGDFFYSRLYAGLYSEAIDEPTKALEYYQQAVDCKYGRTSGDYMTSVAVEALKKVTGQRNAL
jgi:tetratricopeptide (TPR) repeat protein